METRTSNGSKRVSGVRRQDRNKVPTTVVKLLYTEEAGRKIESAQNSKVPVNEEC